MGNAQQAALIREIVVPQGLGNGGTINNKAIGTMASPSKNKIRI
jgi:hypothetical protein